MRTLPRELLLCRLGSLLQDLIAMRSPFGRAFTIWTRALQIELKNMTSLNCNDNPILYPPYAVASEGWDATLTFFEAISDSGKVENSDMKVLVIGLSEAGKTSLIRSVIQNGSYLVRQVSHLPPLPGAMWQVYIMFRIKPF